MRPSLALGVALLALTAGLSSAGGAANGTPRCHTPDLRVYLIPLGGAAGTIVEDLAFRNRSGHSCFVFGHPGLGLEDAQHRLLPSRVTWGSTVARHDPGAHRVVLRPGRAAFASLDYSDVQVRNERCRRPAWLAVIPPDEFTHRLVPFRTIVCNHGHLTVTALSRTRTPHG